MVMLLIMHWQNALVFPNFFYQFSNQCIEICRYTRNGGRPLNRNPHIKVPFEITSLIRQSWAQEPKQRPNAADIVKEISRQQLKLR
jgi:hypothetical protein